MPGISERKCVGCCEMKPKSELIRLVFTENGPVIDEKQKINARGAYICKCMDCVNAAKKNRGFSRSLKRNVPDVVFEMIEGYLNG